MAMRHLATPITLGPGIACVVSLGPLGLTLEAKNLIVKCILLPVTAVWATTILVTLPIGFIAGYTIEYMQWRRGSNKMWAQPKKFEIP